MGRLALAYPVGARRARAETIMLQGETVALRWEQRRGMPRHVPRQAAMSRPQVPICRSADLIPRMGTRGHLE